MNKRVLAIVLATIALPSLQQPAQANAEAARATIAACRASPQACAVVGAAVGTWVLWNNAPKILCTAGTCREMRTQYNEPGKVETHAVTHPNLCRQMEAKFQLQGRRLKLHRIRRTATAGLRYDCEFTGQDAVEGWFHDRRGGR